MLKATPMRSMNARRLNLAVAWLITLLVSVAVAAGGIAWGKAVDCKPGQTDGQCGLGRFLGLLYGVGGGLALFLIASVYFLVVAYRRRKATGHQT
jgi:hypothetical protein